MKFIKPVLVVIALTLIFIAQWFMVNLPSPIKATKENVVVQIISAEWTGSGFILEDGIIVTAAHVMQDVISARAVFSDGTIVYLDPNTYMIDGVWDVAIAKIPDYDGPCAILGDNSDIVIGAGVELIGYPLGEKLWHSFGEVARLEHAGDIDIDCDANPGNSGGPIFIGDCVVGISTCGYSYTDISSGVAVNVVKNMIDRYKILKD
jgi:S1-C subfamily serine protease